MTVLSRSRSTTATRSDRKSTRLNSSHTVIYTLSLHDALPIYVIDGLGDKRDFEKEALEEVPDDGFVPVALDDSDAFRSEEHTSELQSHSDLHSFPTRRSSDLRDRRSRR